MRRLIIMAAAFAVLALPSTAGAIVFGTVDGDGHPNVGGLVSERPFRTGTSIYCSGTLISPTVFLTAAHCPRGAQARVTFDPAYTLGDRVHDGTWHVDPLYSGSQNDPHDLAVVVFSRAIKDIAPARLPAADALSNLPSSQAFTSVGYGVYEVVNGPGGQVQHIDDVRRVAIGTLSAINPFWLRISQNPSTGDGGTCSGDSGGPNFLGTSDIVAATTIIGDVFCRATNVTYRMDTTSARTFLRDFVTLP